MEFEWQFTEGLIAFCMIVLPFKIERFARGHFCLRKSALCRFWHRLTLRVDNLKSEDFYCFFPSRLLTGR
ncbi:hypothetical protein [Desulfovibrio oxyclinae]|uniref:hypothetical protein n=1 Tax=Desulfovibrio oxyclinae TaxID=63560 RepID=UPI00037AC3F9|nr:hypothetical protein [Desulfovibrio oxyclinae]